LKNRNDASPYQEMYIEMAMSMLSPADALTRMRTRYADMINSSSSTLWEEFPAANSNNHAWSAGPLYQLSAWVLGVQPTQPAYNEFVFQPQVTDLTSISAKVPSVKGDITAAYNRTSNSFTQTLTSPANTVAIVAVPKGMLAAGVKEINVNGTVVWVNGSATGSVTGLTFLSEDNAYIRFKVQPGSWTFNAYSQTSANPPAVLYLDCNFTGKAVALPVGNYSLPDLIARGIPNDSVSSLKVMNGYRAILYWDTDFGGNSLIKTADDSCLVNDGWNDALSSVSIQPITTKIEAETYINSSGVISESCSEGTLNVGAIDMGDWMAYSNIVVPQTGTYLVEYRVSGLNGGGKLTLDVNAGSIVLDTLDIPSTGGWQNWQTLTGTFYLTKGTYNFGLYAQTGGWNINWFAFTPVDVTAAARTNTIVRAGEQEPAGNDKATVKLYPNPASNLITVYPGNSGYRYLYITDATGRTVTTKALPHDASYVTINVRNWGRGVYYALFKGGQKGDVVKKVVIE
jgi:carbohydrate binding protein with CBM6 domain/alpha-L-rhamnosidase-like protein/type IX secretion system substrate protein